MSRARGFTLVEAVLTIVLLGILSAMIGLIIQKPIEGQARAQRRAEISDVADTALRRAGRDVRLAVPNSVRVTGAGPVYLELLLTRTGGRYRAESGPSTEDPLDFSASDNIFDTLGNLSTAGGPIVTGASGDIVVIHNLGISGADAWSGDNTARMTSYAAGGGATAGEDRITLTAAKLFPLESPGRRFQIASGPVTYECVGGLVDANGNGMGVLRRVSGYTYNPAVPAQPTGTYSGGAAVVSALLASNVTTCTIDYTVLPLSSRGLVAFTLGISRGGEAVTLYYEVHVSNVP